MSLCRPLRLLTVRTLPVWAVLFVLPIVPTGPWRPVFTLAYSWLLVAVILLELLLLNYRPLLPGADKRGAAVIGFPVLLALFLPSLYRLRLVLEPPHFFAFLGIIAVRFAGEVAESRGYERTSAALRAASMPMLAALGFLAAPLSWPVGAMTFAVGFAAAAVSEDLRIILASGSTVIRAATVPLLMLVAPGLITALVSDQDIPPVFLLVNATLALSIPEFMKLAKPEADAGSLRPGSGTLLLFLAMLATASFLAS